MRIVADLPFSRENGLILPLRPRRIDASKNEHRRPLSVQTTGYGPGWKNASARLTFRATFPLTRGFGAANEHPQAQIGTKYPFARAVETLV
jgi:hypothetical protein